MIAVRMLLNSIAVVDSRPITPRAPCCSAVIINSRSAVDASPIVRTGCGIAVSFFSTASPPPGIDRSSISTSGWRSRTRRSVCVPPPASPTTAKSGCASSSDFMPSRKIS